MRLIRQRNVEQRGKFSLRPRLGERSAADKYGMPMNVTRHVSHHDDRSIISAVAINPHLPATQMPIAKAEGR